MITDIQTLVDSYSPHSPTLTKDKILREIVSGAHVIVKGDSGTYYEWLKSDFKRDDRTSSHYSRKAQYAVNMGDSLQTLLFGVTRDADTWLQVRAHKSQSGEREHVGEHVAKH